MGEGEKGTHVVCATLELEEESSKAKVDYSICRSFSEVIR